MKIVAQRSLNSKVEVDGKITGKIDKGMVLLVGFSVEDTEDKIEYMVNKIINLRIFDDENKVMNKNILDVGGEILSISQFTLYGDARKGNRPSYINSMKADDARIMYQKFNEELSKHIHVETGIFQADMKVSIENDGPVTIILER